MAILALALAAASAPSWAQGAPDYVSAADPDGMVRVLRYAGYVAEPDTDGVGDPMIRTEFSGWPGAFFFYGCDEKTHTGCDSVQLQVAFDRAKPMTAEMALDMAGRERFLSIRLDDEGDPWIEWDIVTGNAEGIPAPVFMKAVNNFAKQIQAVSSRIFAAER
jgi:hypothetical protein